MYHNLKFERGPFRAHLSSQLMNNRSDFFTVNEQPSRALGPVSLENGPGLNLEDY